MPVKVEVNGRIVEFERPPTPDEVDEAADALGIAAAPPPDEDIALGDAFQRRVVDPAKESVEGMRAAFADEEDPLAGTPGAGLVPGAKALWRGLPLLSAPAETIGAGVEAATDSETAGDIAAFTADVAIPYGGLAKKGIGIAGKTLSRVRKAETVEQVAGRITKEALTRKVDTTIKAAHDAYDEAATLATQANVRVTRQQVKTVQDKADDILNTIPNLPKPVKDMVENLATHPGNATYAQWDQIRRELQQMGLKPEKYALSDNATKKALTQLGLDVKDALKKAAGAGTPAGKALDAGDEAWAAAHDLKRLAGRKTLIKAERGGSTGAESFRRLYNDPERLKAAKAAMTPDEQAAFKTLERAYKISKTATGAAKAIGFSTLVGVAAGGGIGFSEHGHGDMLTTALGGLGGAALMGMAIANPRIAVLLARAHKTPASGTAAYKLAKEIVELVEVERQKAAAQDEAIMAGAEE